MSHTHTTYVHIQYPVTKKKKICRAWEGRLGHRGCTGTSLQVDPGSQRPQWGYLISQQKVRGKGERHTEKRAGSGGGAPMKNKAFLGCPGLTLPCVSEVSRHWFLKTNFSIRGKKITILILNIIYKDNS